MKTETKNTQEQLTETTRELYVPKNVVGSVLTALEEKSIQTDYLGLAEDGSGRIVFKTRTFDWQEPHLRKIISDMESDSAMITLLLTVLSEIVGSGIKQYQQKQKLSTQIS